MVSNKSQSRYIVLAEPTRVGVCLCQSNGSQTEDGENVVEMHV